LAEAIPLAPQANRFLLPSHPVRESEVYLGIGGIILLIIILYLLFR
jgi:hypothetical protein